LEVDATMSERTRRFLETHDEIMKCHSEEDYMKLIARYMGQTFDFEKFKNMPPLISLLDSKGKLIFVQITHCDWCGALLPHHYEMVDDAIRCMYFCSEECLSAFDAKYPPGVGGWPGIKLSVRGLFVRLKDL
jgi:hypothetical protein